MRTNGRRDWQGGQLFDDHLLGRWSTIRLSKTLDVVVEGDAVQVTDDEALFRLARAWTTKWDGGWQFQVRNGSFQLGGDTILVFSVTPTKVFAFAKGHISHTRHQF